MAGTALADATSLIEAGRLGEALALLAGAPADDPRVGPLRRAAAAEALRRGVDLHQRDDLDGAAEHYRLSIVAEPAEAQAWRLLGLTAARRREAEGACRLLRVAVALDPSLADAAVALGSVLATRDRTKDACAAWGWAARLLPLDAGAWMTHGGLLLRLGRPAGARDAFLRAAGLRPDRFEPLLNLAEALDGLGQAGEAARHRARGQALRRRIGFRDCVDTVAIEVSSYCNRRCAYCPNSTHDRISGQRFMSDALFDRILGDLASIGYARTLLFHLYNEPLADRRILSYVARAHERLPGARLSLSTNGDYLDRAYLEDLHAAGLRDVHVSLHLQPGEAHTESRLFRRLELLEKAVGIAAEPDGYAVRERFAFRLPFRDMTISVSGVDYARQGTNRGGLLDGVGQPVGGGRTSLCLLPLTMFVVYHDGRVTPCCHIMADAPEHAAHVVGTVAEADSIFDVYAGQALSAWRRSLNLFGPKAEPCGSCSYWIDNPTYNDPAVQSLNQRAMDAFGL